jgi:hypothetical protein
MPSSRITAQALGAGRAALGAALLLTPDLVTPRWVGDAGTTDAGRVMARGLGARDIVIGAGTMTAGRGWILAGVGADLADLFASGTAGGIPRNGRIGTAALAGGSALLGAWLATQLD